MEPQQIPEQPMASGRSDAALPKRSGATFAVIALIIVLLLAAWWWMSENPALAPTTGGQPPATGQVSPPLPQTGTPGALEQQAANVDLGDLSKEFQSIDADLNSL